MLQLSAGSWHPSSSASLKDTFHIYFVDSIQERWQQWVDNVQEEKVNWCNTTDRDRQRKTEEQKARDAILEMLNIYIIYIDIDISHTYVSKIELWMLNNESYNI